MVYVQQFNLPGCTGMIPLLPSDKVWIKMIFGR